jgi:predicted transcriptional regulator
MPDDPSVHAFRLRERGLERVLGGIEAAVMEVFWSQRGPLRIAEVRDALAARDRPLSFNAVMTVMNNLVTKGCLARDRERDARSYVYTARIGKEDFLASVTRQVAQGLVRDFGSLAVSQFLDVLRAEDPEGLDRLRRLLAEEGEGRGGDQ